VVLGAFVEAAAHDAGDFFEFEIARGKAIEVDPDHPLQRAIIVEPLPAALRLADEQLADWEPRWHRATRGAPIDFDQAQAVAAEFMDPVLRHSVERRRWIAAEQRWS
jgi:hypothetical protein